MQSAHGGGSIDMRYIEMGSTDRVPIEMRSIGRGAHRQDPRDSHVAGPCCQ